MPYESVTTPSVEKKLFDKQHDILVECECVGTCSILRIVPWEDDDDFCLSIHHYTDTYCTRYPLWNRFSHRLKVAWAILRGKEYYFYDVILGFDQAVKLYSALGKTILNKRLSAEENSTPCVESVPMGTVMEA